MPLLPPSTPPRIPAIDEWYPQRFRSRKVDQCEAGGQVAPMAPHSVEKRPAAWPLPDPGELILHPLRCWLGQTARLK